MKKRSAFMVLAVVFGLGAIVGMKTPGAQAGACYYTCICSVPYKCCKTIYGTSCKKDTSGNFLCTQNYDC